MSGEDARLIEHRTAYDRYVAVMRIVLIAAAALLTALLALWPLLREGESSFVLNEETMRSAAERVEILRPRYEGTDSLNRLFTVTAERAEQSSPDDPTVMLEGLAARMELGEGRLATATADGGVYDTDREVLRVPDSMQLRTSDGYRLDAQDARIDLVNKMIVSERPVEGEGPLGQIEANRFTIDIDARKAVFEGDVRMRTIPARRE